MQKGPSSREPRSRVRRGQITTQRMRGFEIVICHRRSSLAGRGVCISMVGSVGTSPTQIRHPGVGTGVGVCLWAPCSPADQKWSVRTCASRAQSFGLGPQSSCAVSHLLFSPLYPCSALPGACSEPQLKRLTWGATQDDGFPIEFDTSFHFGRGVFTAESRQWAVML